MFDNVSERVHTDRVTCRHGNDEGACFACKLRTIQFGNVQAPPERTMEAQWAKDLPAYQRLRNQGLQPKRTVGCAELEGRANSQLEVDLHTIIAPDVLKQTLPAIQEGMAMARDSEWNPADKSTHGDVSAS